MPGQWDQRFHRKKTQLWVVSTRGEANTNGAVPLETTPGRQSPGSEREGDLCVPMSRQTADSEGWGSNGPEEPVAPGSSTGGEEPRDCGEHGTGVWRPGRSGVGTEIVPSARGTGSQAGPRWRQRRTGLADGLTGWDPGPMTVAECPGTPPAPPEPQRCPLLSWPSLLLCLPVSVGSSVLWTVAPTLQTPGAPSRCFTPRPHLRQDTSGGGVRTVTQGFCCGNTLLRSVFLALENEGRMCLLSSADSRTHQTDPQLACDNDLSLSGLVSVRAASSHRA